MAGQIGIITPMNLQNNLSSPSRFHARFSAVVCAVLGIVVVSCCSFCTAQEVIDDLARRVVDLKQRIERDESIIESVKTDLNAQALVAEANLSKVEEFRKRIAADQQATATATERAATHASELEKMKTTVPAPPDPNIEPSKLDLANIDLTKLDLAKLDLTQFDPAKLEDIVGKQKTALESFKQDILRNEQETTRRTSRRLTLRADLDTLEKKINEFKDNLSALPKDDKSLAEQAKRIVLQTGQSAAVFERNSLIAEQERYDRSEQEKVLRNERDLLNLKQAQGQARLAALENIQAKVREAVAKKDADAAARALEDMKKKNSLLVKSYEKNEELAKQVQTYEARALTGKEKLASVKAELSLLERQSRDTYRRVGTIGLTGSVGAMLRKRKSELPSISLSLSNADAIKTEMNEVQYKIFDVEQQRDQLSPELIQSEIETANGGLVEQVVLEGMNKSIDEVIDARRKTLDDLRTSLDRYFEDILAETEYSERQTGDPDGCFRGVHQRANSLDQKQRPVPLKNRTGRIGSDRIQSLQLGGLRPAGLADGHEVSG